MRNHERVFSRMEIGIVVVLILVLAGLVLVRFGKTEDQRAEREAVVALEHIYQLQSMFFLKHQTYSEDLNKLSFEREEPGNSTRPGRYHIRVESANERGFTAIAAPSEAGLPTIRLDHSGKLRYSR